MFINTFEIHSLRVTCTTFEIEKRNNILMLVLSQRNSSRNKWEVWNGFLIKLSNILKSFKSLWKINQFKQNISKKISPKFDKILGCYTNPARGTPRRDLGSRGKWRANLSQVRGNLGCGFSFFLLWFFSLLFPWLDPVTIFLFGAGSISCRRTDGF
jgi:hypothetical protein